MSQHLRELIATRITAAGGWITFADYMELALYCPGLGYYSNGARKFGVDGDFVTAPELGPRFAGCLARQLLAWLSPELPDVLEFGPGSGRLAFDLLLALHAQGRAPRRYCLLERSGDLRQRQQQLLATLPADLKTEVVWLEQLPSGFTGVILANEVLDALPPQRIGWRDEGLVECGVTWDGQRLLWTERPLADEATRALATALPCTPPYTSEVNRAASAWVGSLLDSLQQGVVLFIDYGYGRAEFYHPQRNQGTLTGFYRHRQLNDPFHWPGLMDLTSHVDFTAVADAAIEANGQLLGYTTQAAFLLACGLTDSLRDLDPQTPAYLRAAQEVQRLTHPAEMGELFKVMAVGKGVDEPGPGFDLPGREYQL